MQRISLEYRLIIKKLNTLIMKRQFLLIIALFFTVYNALAQYTVIGCVTDSTGTGEPYATIRIFNKKYKIATQRCRNPSYGNQPQRTSVKFSKSVSRPDAVLKSCPVCTSLLMAR